MLRVKTRSEDNRVSMASHPRILDTLATLCLQAGNADDESEGKDGENATKAIAHLTNEPHNHKLMCTRSVLSSLVYGASLTGPRSTIKESRDAAILAMERLATEHSNRQLMARHPGMLVSIARAAEREMNEELTLIPATLTSGPRLAKPLLMSLLVAM